MPRQAKIVMLMHIKEMMALQSYNIFRYCPIVLLTARLHKYLVGSTASRDGSLVHDEVEDSEEEIQGDVNKLERV